MITNHIHLQLLSYSLTVLAYHDCNDFSGGLDRQSFFYSRHSIDQDATRLLWITTAEYLTSYINRTHEVNQGDSLDHDFSVILELLCFPITKLFKIDLPLAVMKDISTCWSNLFSSFVRESSLLSTVEDNQTVEEFCSKMIRLVENGDIILTVSV